MEKLDEYTKLVVNKLDSGGIHVGYGDIHRGAAWRMTSDDALTLAYGILDVLGVTPPPEQSLELAKRINVIMENLRCDVINAHEAIKQAHYDVKRVTK